MSYHIVYSYIREFRVLLFTVQVQEVFLYRKSRGKYGPNADGATAATLSIRINVLGFPSSAMFSHDAFSDQSAIIFHALVVALPPMVYILYICTFYSNHYHHASSFHRQVLFLRNMTVAARHLNIITYKLIYYVNI